jgi:hypothetical protein
MSDQESRDPQHQFLYASEITELLDQTPHARMQKGS